jgi:hypothetical protein
MQSILLQEQFGRSHLHRPSISGSGPQLTGRWVHFAQFIDSVGSMEVDAFVAGARSIPTVVPFSTDAAIISIRENSLDHRLSRDGAMMYKKNLWAQATSASAATKSKRSRFAKGRAVGRASNMPAWWLAA